MMARAVEGAIPDSPTWPPQRPEEAMAFDFRTNGKAAHSDARPATPLLCVQATYPPSDITKVRSYLRSSRESFDQDSKLCLLRGLNRLFRSAGLQLKVNEVHKVQ